MTQRRRTAILLAILVTILIAIPVLVLFGRERPEGQVQQLRDGTRVYLKAVTYGTNHSAGRNMYGLRLPFPIERYDHKTEQSALVFWVFVEPTEAGGFEATKWDTMNTVLDESACWITQAETRVSTFGPVKRPWVPQSLISVKAFVFDAFPRRRRKLTLRLVDRTGLEPTIELEAENPIDQTFPAWKPEPMPLTETENTVTLTLDSLVVSPPTAPAPANRLVGPPWIRARFRVREIDKPTSAWKPVEIRISDATGNQVFNTADHHDLSVRYGQPNTGEMLVEIKKGLCPLETAWKLQIKLEKERGNARLFEFLAKASTG